MKVRFSVILGLTLLTGCANNGALLKDLEQVAGQVISGSAGGGLSINEISQGLKQALTIGSGQVVSRLGQPDGFNQDPVIRIPLPTSLERARRVAAKVGLDSSFDSLETRLNRAAELATPKAKDLFITAISQMTVDDAKGILEGPDDSATQYFRGAMGARLSDAMRPIVDDSLAQVGAVRAFNEMLEGYRQIPFAPPLDANLSDHVVEYGMNGIFHYIATEEKAIREDPLKRTTELLRRVFGG